MKKSILLTSLLSICASMHAKNTPVLSVKSLKKGVKTEAKETIKKHTDLAKYLKKSSAQTLENLLYHIATSDKLIVVKFYADWCGPCRKMAPIVKRVAKKQESTTEFIEINIDKESAIAQAFGVRAIPTLVFFKDGKEAFRTNSMTESQLNSKIDNLTK